jgi:hypothetical protein
MGPAVEANSHAAAHATMTKTALVAMTSAADSLHALTSRWRRLIGGSAG